MNETNSTTKQQLQFLFKRFNLHDVLKDGINQHSCKINKYAYNNISIFKFSNKNLSFIMIFIFVFKHFHQNQHKHIKNIEILPRNRLAL